MAATSVTEFRLATQQQKKHNHLLPSIWLFVYPVVLESVGLVVSGEFTKKCIRCFPVQSMQNNTSVSIRLSTLLYTNDSLLCLVVRSGTDVSVCSTYYCGPLMILPFPKCLSEALAELHRICELYKLKSDNKPIYEQNSFPNMQMRGLRTSKSTGRGFPS